MSSSWQAKSVTLSCNSGGRSAKRVNFRSYEASILLEPVSFDSSRPCILAMRVYLGLTESSIVTKISMT